MRFRPRIWFPLLAAGVLHACVCVCLLDWSGGAKHQSHLGLTSLENKHKQTKQTDPFVRLCSFHQLQRLHLLHDRIPGASVRPRNDRSNMMDGE